MATETSDIADELTPEQLEQLEGFERELGEAFTDLGHAEGADKALIERLADGAMPSLPGAATSGGATATGKVGLAVFIGGAVALGVGAWLATRSPEVAVSDPPQVPALEDAAHVLPVPEEPNRVAPTPAPDSVQEPPSPVGSESGDPPAAAPEEPGEKKTSARRRVPPKPVQDDDAKISASELLKAANAARRTGDHAKAKRGYERLSREYPRSREDLIGRVSLGKLELDKLGDASAALRHFDAYLDARPDGNLAEEALHGRAQALRRLGKTGKERAAWTELLRRFPDSVHATKAQQRLGKGDG